jgi:hypothetical protein
MKLLLLINQILIYIFLTKDNFNIPKRIKNMMADEY